MSGAKDDRCLQGVPVSRDQPSSRPLLDKLGVKPGIKVSVLGLHDLSATLSALKMVIPVAQRPKV